MAKPVYTLAQVLTKIAGTPEYGTGATVSYAFTAPSSSPYGAVSALNSVQKAATVQAMSLWDDVSNLRFSQNAAGSEASIKLFNVANGSFAGAQLGSQIMLSSNYYYMTAPTQGNYGMMAIIHEIGHSLGLNHPGAYNGGSPTYAKNAQFMQDTQQYTVMSYFSASNSGANHGGYYASTPLLYDIAALHKMYGADMTTRTGDTVYGFNSNAGGSAYDFTVNQHPIICIWDAGGLDTIDVSGFSTNQLVDLHAGSFSNVADLTKNLSIAYNANIENATGGSGNDTLIGNALNNVLRGGAGNDVLNGDTGEDRLYGGSGNDAYTVNSAGDVVYENYGEGTDIVYSSVTYVISGNIENLTLTGTAGINGTGNGLANTLTGNNAANVLDGGAGNDVMMGGIGNDTYMVDSGSDVVRELSGQGIDTVYSSASFMLGDNIENLVFTGLTSTNGTGNALNNTITGNAANNVLSGGGGVDYLRGDAGNDTLNGQAGYDQLWGGLGADVFVFDATARGGRDVIKDFNIAQGDALDIHSLLVGFNASQLESFVRLTQSGSSEALFIDSDGAGRAFSFVQFAMLENVNGLTARSLFNGGDLLV